MRDLASRRRPGDPRRPSLRVRYPCDTTAWLGLICEVAAEVLRARGALVEVQAAHELDIGGSDVELSDSVGVSALVDMRIEGDGPDAATLIHDWHLLVDGLRAFLAAVERHERTRRN